MILNTAYMADCTNNKNQAIVNMVNKYLLDYLKYKCNYVECKSKQR